MMLDVTYRPLQGTKIFQYCTLSCRTSHLQFSLSCKHMHLSFKSICNKEHKEVICLPRVILPKAPILQDECFANNYSSFLDFTHNYKRTNGIFVLCFNKNKTCSGHSKEPSQWDGSFEHPKHVKTDGLENIYNFHAKFLGLSNPVYILNISRKLKWACTWDFQQCGMCDQQRLRPACAYAQTDQSLC